jgi:hypothetical protein
MPLLIGDLLIQGAKATGENLDHFTARFADFAEQFKGDADLRGESILNYLTRLETRASPRAICTLLEFIDTRHGQGEVVDHAAYDQLAGILETINADTRADRHLTGLLTNDRIAADRVADRVIGAYVMLRWESGIPAYNQELLLVESQHIKNRWQNLVTYIRGTLVHRGIWNMIQGSLKFSLAGHSAEGHPKQHSFSFPIEGGFRNDVFAGCLKGLGTVTNNPIVMPIVMLRLPGDAHQHAAWLKLATKSDAYLRNAYNSLDTEIGPSHPLFRVLKQLEDSLPVQEIEAKKFAVKIRNEWPESDDLISPSLMKWLHTVVPVSLKKQRPVAPAAEREAGIAPPNAGIE